MLDLKFLRSNLDRVKAMMENRGYDLDISVFESIDSKRREMLPALEGLRHQRNRVDTRSERIVVPRLEREFAVTFRRNRNRRLVD